jgi:hypothetical protein
VTSATTLCAREGASVTTIVHAKLALEVGLVSS